MSGARTAHSSKRAQPAETVSTPSNWLLYTSLVLSAICLLGLFSSEIADTDFWWHLRTGQFIVERHSLPVPDPFAYTTALQKPAYPGEEQIRHFNLTHEWLSQALMYAVYAIGGFPAIGLFRAAMLAAVCGLSGFLAWRMSGNAYVGIAAAFATASVAIEFRADRPTLVTFPVCTVVRHDTRSPARIVGAGAALFVVGQLPRRLLHGMGGASSLLRWIDF